MQLAEAATRAEELARASGSEQELATLRAQWDDEIEAAARSGDYRVRARWRSLQSTDSATVDRR